jgi:hypothetical protein
VVFNELWGVRAVVSDGWVFCTVENNNHSWNFNGKAELDSTGCQKGSNKVELLESIAQRRLLRGFWIVGGDHRDWAFEIWCKFHGTISSGLLIVWNEDNAGCIDWLSKGDWSISWWYLDVWRAVTL